MIRLDPPISWRAELREPFTEATEVLADCKRYLTEFGSVEPSNLVRRINDILETLRREKDERCMRWQHETANRARGDRGEPLLTYSMFLSGAEGGEAP